MKSKLKKKDLATDDDDRNRFEVSANIEEIHETKSDLKNDCERGRHEIHRFPSEVCDVHGSKKSCDWKNNYYLSLRSFIKMSEGRYSDKFTT